MIDLTGLRFGRLEVLEMVGKDKYGITQWECACECGNTTTASISNLRNGNTTSCGCYARQRKREANTTHGETGTRLHRIWKAMHTRCNNPKFFAYSAYGGRGIKVCAEWDDFNAFKDWAMSHGYSNELTIDRINNDKGYSPDNCRWATMAEQNKNKRAANGHKVKEE